MPHGSMANGTISSQPVFETDRLLLRPRTPADTDACIAMDRDPAVTRFVTGPWSDPVAHRAFIEARTRGPYAPGLGYWIICRRDTTDSFLGWVLLIPADGTRREIEIGWRLPRGEWQQGIATEAAFVLLRHAFVTLKLPEVSAEIHPDNIGSQRVAEKLGLRNTGLVVHMGEPALRYSMTCEAFFTAQRLR
jgi:RimJ/RimL family protein N-acetyltransferase